MRTMWLLALAATGSSAVVRAQSGDLEAAQRDAVQAFDAYMRDDFAGAGALYERSLEAESHRSVVFDLARLYATKLHSPRTAEGYYRRYLRDESGPSEPDRAALATAAIKTPSPTTHPEEAPSLPPFPRSDAKVKSSQPLQATHYEPGSSRARLVTSAISAGTGLTALGVGAGLSVLARRYADVAHGTCEGETCWSQRGIDATSSGRRIAHTATAMLIGGGALSALGLTLFLVRHPRERRVDRAQLELHPFVSAASAGAAMKGQW
jgi:hypothetical protein